MKLDEGCELITPLGVNNKQVFNEKVLSNVCVSLAKRLNFYTLTISLMQLLQRSRKSLAAITGLLLRWLGGVGVRASDS